jgi:hypothetical protein
LGEGNQEFKSQKSKVKKSKVKSQKSDVRLVQEPFGGGRHRQNVTLVVYGFREGNVPFRGNQVVEEPGSIHRIPEEALFGRNAGSEGVSNDMIAVVDAMARREVLGLAGRDRYVGEGGAVVKIRLPDSPSRLHQAGRRKRLPH